MKTAEQVIADNPNLSCYRVMLREHRDAQVEIAFDCFGEDGAHAAEQALDAYPDGAIISTAQIDPRQYQTPSSYVIYSASEAANSDDGLDFGVTMTAGPRSKVRPGSHRQRWRN